ncbi:GNAT family N-acetyltransferase [Tenuibacillus multivorans]|uniref:Protein N-acetyltransferase, RimJ/RimL family n=2 Tax=Tenuibacillus multivorans TaxID=237069 RepID=A0A1H0B0W5_9BACI|nr:GNAT family protein [Tenuibacillus multivorans]SDN38933.1 Protein N-acetyltransferase, RimJ/RimL family [Tenuibacillus multivorans]
MNYLDFQKFDGEIDELIDLYTKNEWHYHANPNPSPDEIRERFKSGWFHDDKETFWVLENNQKIGLIIITDVSDTIPLLYDIRLLEEIRGQGYGEKCVKWVTDYIFLSSTNKIRIEAYTRHDNYAMRKVFHKCDYEKEGYLRDSWENDDGRVYDSVLYAMIRSDWEKDQQTPININDVPY